eukprot:gene25362-33902_t
MKANLFETDKVTPTSDEFIRLRRVAFEYDLEGKTIKLSAPITLLDISRVSFSGGIRSLVFAGGIWLVPTFVGTLQVVEENDAVISIGGNSEGVGGSHNIYVIISSYLYWVKYSESEGLQCQSFPLSDATIHGNTIQSMIVVMESTFGLIFSAVLNNGVIVMCRVILRHTPIRTTSLISLTLNSAEGDPSQDNGICIFGDNIATSCRGFAVFIQPFLIWNGFQVNRITPSSPSSWIDLDVILSSTCDGEEDSDNVLNVEIPLHIIDKPDSVRVTKPTTVTAPVPVEEAQEKPCMPQYLLNLLDNLGASLYLSDSDAKPPKSQLLDLTESAPAIPSDVSMEEFLQLLNSEESSNLFSDEFIGDELKLSHPRRKQSLTATHKESALLPADENIVNMNTQALNFGPDSKELVRDIDLSEKHWLDALDIVTLFPTSRADLGDGINLVISKYVDCFQLPRIIEGISGTLNFPASHGIDRHEQSTRKPGDSSVYRTAVNPVQSCEMINASYNITPVDSFEVLFHRILFGSAPADLFAVVLELMEMQERHMEIVLASASSNVQQKSDKKNISGENGDGNATNHFSEQSERLLSDLDSPSEFGFSPMYPRSSQATSNDNPTAFRKHYQPSFDVEEDSDDGFSSSTRTKKSPMPSALLYNENLLKSKAASKAKPNYRDLQVKNALGIDDDDDGYGNVLPRRLSLQPKEKRQQQPNEVVVDPYHIDIIQRSCALAANVIASHVCTTSRSGVQQQNLARHQEDSLLRILLRGGRRVEAAEALALWNRPYSLYLLCIRVAASSNVICAGFNIDANNDSCFDPHVPSMQSLSYYQGGRGQHILLRDLARRAACPLERSANDISEWTTTYGRRWTFDTSCLDELNQLSEEPKPFEHSSWQSNDFGGMHGSSTSFASASSSSIGAGQEIGLGSIECDMDAFSPAQVRMMEAHQVFEKTLIYFLTREGDDSVEFLISLFDFRPLSLPIPTIASIYDKNAHVSIKRAGIWERMIEKAS